MERAKHKPSADKMLLYFRTMWTEVRSAVLKAIWDVRCAIMMGGMTSREEARTHAHQQIRNTLSSLIYSKIPTALGGRAASPPSRRDQIFYRATWGQLVPGLVSEQFQLVDSPPPPPSGGEGGEAHP